MEPKTKTLLLITLIILLTTLIFASTTNPNKSINHYAKILNANLLGIQIDQTTLTKECKIQTICITPQEECFTQNKEVICTPQKSECTITTTNGKETTTCTPPKEECKIETICTPTPIEKCTTTTTNDLTITKCTLPQEPLTKEILLELLPENEQTKYYSLQILRNNKPTTISIPIYPENLVPPSIVLDTLNYSANNYLEIVTPQQTLGK